MQKLELNWIGKYDTATAVRPEPRILIENPKYSYGEENNSQLSSLNSQFNLLIHGDNLLALKSLELEYAGRVKCICIDPPYNTGSAFEHYDDNLEHSTWLSLMKPRLDLFKNLLADDGSLWVILDDSEVHYLKVVCDEVFGRKNFIADITWNSRKSVSNDAIISLNTNHILVYAKNIDIIRAMAKRSELFKGPMDESKFDNPDNDPRGKWVADPMDAPNIRPNLTYPITNPKTGIQHLPPSGRCWRISQEKFSSASAEGRVIFGKNGTSKPQLKRYLSECFDKGTVMTTLWADIDTTTNATKHSQQLFGDSPFTNPKPENLIERILTLATNPGDLVLDSFLGSGTTAAVAHKMGRRWIGIELGDHAYTHCYPRLKAVVDGEQGGISKAQNWQGGGGFKFYELATSVLEKDKYGNMIISKEYNAEMLAAAMARHEGYTYAPDDVLPWKQGYSGERNFIFTTTAAVTPEYLDYIASELGSDEFLLICAKSYDKACEKRYKNIIVHPIPKILLGRCEYGKDNYDLNVILADSGEWEGEADD